MLFIFRKKLTKGAPLKSGAELKFNLCLSSLNLCLFFKGGEKSVLDITNLLLGLGVIILFVLVIVTLFRDTFRKMRERKQYHDVRDELLRILSKVGVTMQDGGKKLEEEEKEETKDS